ncbi:MarR family winged helix-turn-helix transcriptional regulator [Kineococcus terrestris]|uniref:MarR family winged helix-turn-helix transcriptional regulator n=1 Tax=Kineococcus terrestris TaxID=2044856 RepID=UPI0034DB087A
MADVADDARDWPTGRLLSTAARLVEHAWDDALAAHELTHSRVVALHLLLDGPTTQRDLARRAGVEEQTMGRVLRGMEERGQVARARDSADRRRTLVSVTDAGREALRVATGLSDEDPVLRVVEGTGSDPRAFRAALLALVQHFAARRWPDAPDAPRDARSPS